MKTGIFFSVIFTSVLLLSIGSVMCGDDKGAESIVVNGGSIGMVPFPHGRHQGILVDCKPCHDLFAKEAEVIDKLKAENKLQKKEVMNMCKGCHQDLAAKGQKAGPTACKDCHKKS